MLDKNLLCIILIFIVIVLLFKIFKVETFETELDPEEYKKTKTRLLKELKDEVLESESISDDGSNTLLKSQELQTYFDELKSKLETSVDDASLVNFLKIEKQCIQNRDYGSTINS